MERFTKKYPVSKTISFELKPYKATARSISNNKIIENDRIRAAHLERIQAMIDDFYRHFINDIFNGIKSSPLSFEAAEACLAGLREGNGEKKKYQEEKKLLREEIAKRFSNAPDFKNMFGAKMLSEILPERADAEEKIILDDMKDTAALLISFFRHRSAIFKANVDHISIPYRIVEENFEIFSGNRVKLEKIIRVLGADEVRRIYSLFPLSKSLSLTELLSIGSYNYFLAEDDIKSYNEFILGWNKEPDVFEKGLVAYIREYNQKADVKLPVPQKLNKQILGSKTEIYLTPVENDDELKDMIVSFIDDLMQEQIFDRFGTLLTKWASFDLDRIYVGDKSLSQLSSIVTGRWNTIRDALNELQLKHQTSSKCYSYSTITAALDHAKAEAVLESFVTIDGSMKKAEKELYVSVLRNVTSCRDKLLRAETISHNREMVTAIKDCLQNILDYYRMMSVFDTEDKNVDPDFYDEFAELYSYRKNALFVFHRSQSYLTRKPADQAKKMRVCFNNPSLIEIGFAENEKSVMLEKPMILRRNGVYYLGILNKHNKPALRVQDAPGQGEYFEKMHYKQLQDPKRMLPKIIFVKAVKEHFSGSDEDYVCSNPKNFIEPFHITRHIYDIYHQDAIPGKKKFQMDYLRETGDEEGYRSALCDWITFCLAFLKAYRSSAEYDFSALRAPSEYDRLDVFYDDLKIHGYRTGFKFLSAESVDHAVESGQLYLFQIYNKALKENGRIDRDIYAIYFRQLFSEDNLKNADLKLNSGCKIFYRDVVVKNPVCHEIGSALVNRTDKFGNTIPEEIYVELYEFYNGNVPILSDRAREWQDRAVVKRADRHLVKDKRYTEKKMFVSFSVDVNFNVARPVKNLNQDVQDWIRETRPNILSIDRGEHNLLFITLMNQNGEILCQRSLNSIRGVDYNAKLSAVMQERREEQANWQQKRKIADLKEGYLKCAVSEIARMAVENHAVIILEDLDSGFKSKRSAVEKSIYQKFETMLAKRLSCLSFKNIPMGEAGSYSNPYQLTNHGDYADGRQNGIIFKVPAAYTSGICPVTGFVSLFRLKDLTSIEKKKAFFASFDSIAYDKQLEEYVFRFNYNSFQTYTESFRKNWRIGSAGCRREFSAAQKAAMIDLTEAFTALFHDFHIDSLNEPDLFLFMRSIKSGSFWNEFFRLFCLMLQMKNYGVDGEDDWIFSPAISESGHFNSLLAEENLPKSKEANDAYHIGLKGLYVLNVIQKSTGPVTYKQLSITNGEWMEFIQRKIYSEKFHALVDDVS